MIAEGVTIGGVDVGGLDADAARSQVRTNLVTPLEKAVKVKYEGEEYELTPNELDIHAGVDRTVDEALTASREGGLPTRFWRSVSGGEVNVAIRPELAYDHDQLDHFISHVSGNIGRDPVDASIDPSGGVLTPVAARTGFSIDESALRRDVEAAIADPANRTVEPKVEKVKPEVTTSELAAKYPTYLVVDRANFTLTLYRNLKEEVSYTVAIGAEGYDTPTGLYNIQSKQVDPVWNVPDSDWAGSLAGQTIPPGPENPLKARWMGFYNGAGIHGTSDIASLGSAASHGCVRMDVPDVIDLYDRVDIGTPVYIS
ncbi:MAG: L,D-transpeptidase/peptidoglycan binding protein [Solirubrobacterales bacterium]|nr:L,D-transpeptidase/peptidoglycan binding protein [Solirubrobacterales bacterium]